MRKALKVIVGFVSLIALAGCGVSENEKLAAQRSADAQASLVLAKGAASKVADGESIVLSCAARDTSATENFLSLTLTKRDASDELTLSVARQTIKKDSVKTSADGTETKSPTVTTQSLSIGKLKLSFLTPSVDVYESVDDAKNETTEGRSRVTLTVNSVVQEVELTIHGRPTRSLTIDCLNSRIVNDNSNLRNFNF